MIPALLLACAAAGVGAEAPAGVEPEGSQITELPLSPRVPGGATTPFGYWGLNGLLTPTHLADLRGRIGLAVVHTASADPKYVVGTLLPMAREAGIRVSLRLTGDHGRYTTASGDFDRAAWERQLDRFVGAGLEPFIAEGTLFAHMIIDDFDTFAGLDPTAADLDAMAAASKARFPELTTFVREKATTMPLPEGGRYREVDAVVNQYRTRDGDLDRYVADTTRTARALDLAQIQGLNIADGGDGSSGQPGWQKGRHAMSAAEILRYGRALAAAPDVGAFLLWEYDAEERWADDTVGADYFRRTEVEAALGTLAQEVAARPAAGLRRQR